MVISDGYRFVANKVFYGEMATQVVTVALSAMVFPSLFGNISFDDLATITTSDSHINTWRIYHMGTNAYLVKNIY